MNAKQEEALRLKLRRRLGFINPESKERAEPVDLFEGYIIDERLKNE